MNESHGKHMHSTLFINGGNCGNLCMDLAEHDWFYLVLEKGVEALAKDGDLIFVASGQSHGDENTEFPLPIPKHRA